MNTESLQNAAFGSSIAKSLWQKLAFILDSSPDATGGRKTSPLFHPVLLFIVVAGTCMIPGKVMRVACTLPIVFVLAASQQMYTTGTPWDDYNTALIVFVLLLAYLDFWIITPFIGEDLKILEEGQAEAKTRSNVKYVGEDDCKTWRDKLVWSLRLHTTLRGVQWDWQIKSLERNGSVRNSTKRNAFRCALVSAGSWLCGRLALYVFGACKTLQYQEWSVGHWFYSPFLFAAVGWCGLCWIWTVFISCYWGLAALTLGFRTCSKWQWPVLFGDLQDAWSVRQAWGIVWHQCLRRRIERISIPFTRSIGLRKGTLGSKYVQLFVGFAITTLMHEWGVLCSTRQDGGEFWFILSQPVIIAIEDLVQFGYRKISGKRKTDFATPWELCIGLTWTFLWFSYSLGPLMQGLLDEQQIPGGDWLGKYPLIIGSRHAFFTLSGEWKLIMTKAGWRYNQWQ